MLAFLRRTRRYQRRRYIPQHARIQWHDPGFAAPTVQFPKIEKPSIAEVLPDRWGPRDINLRNAISRGYINLDEL